MLENVRMVVISARIGNVVSCTVGVNETDRPIN